MLSNLMVRISFVLKKKAIQNKGDRMQFIWSKAEMTDRRTPPRVMGPKRRHFDGRPSSISPTDVLARILRVEDSQKTKKLSRLRKSYSK